MLLSIRLRRNGHVIPVLIFQIGIGIVRQIDLHILKGSLDGRIVHTLWHNMSEIMSDIRRNCPQPGILFTSDKAVKEISPFLIGAERKKEAHRHSQTVIDLSGSCLIKEFFFLRAVEMAEYRRNGNILQRQRRDSLDRTHDGIFRHRLNGKNVDVYALRQFGIQCLQTCL